MLSRSLSNRLTCQAVKQVSAICKVTTISASCVGCNACSVNYVVGGVYIISMIEDVAKHRSIQNYRRLKLQLITP